MTKHGVYKTAKYFLACVLCLLVVTSVIASPVPPFLKRLQQKGTITIIRQFPAAAGLTGWVIKNNGRYTLVYSMPGEKYILTGGLIGPTGINLSKQYYDKYAPKPDFAHIVSQLRHDPSLITEGNKHAPEIFVYLDPNCIYCNLFWTHVRPYVKAGKIKVHWVMVGFLHKSSPGRAAAILLASNRAAALAEDELKFDKNKEEGGIKPPAKIPASITHLLTAHFKQMNAAGGFGTPTILFRRQGKWTAIYGMPRDISSFIGSVIAG